MGNPVALNVSGNVPLGTTEWVGLTETDSNKWPAFCLQCTENVLLSIQIQKSAVIITITMVIKHNYKINILQRLIATK